MVNNRAELVTLDFVLLKKKNQSPKILKCLSNLGEYVQSLILDNLTLPLGGYSNKTARVVHLNPSILWEEI